MARIHLHKLGGAALADAAAFAAAVEIVRSRPPGRVIVVSAMGGVTDALLGAAREAGEGNERALADAARSLAERHRAIAAGLLPRGRDRTALVAAITRSFGELESFAHGLATLRELTPKTSDYIVARGERMSARILTAALAAAGTRASYVDAMEVIRCDDQYGSATPELDATDRAARAVLRPLLARGVTPIVPGFIGRSTSGHVATLGRGGSDLTATLLARSLRAASVTLWKDVPGLLTADPRLVPDARVIPQLTPREAAELAYYGARVLHPRALIPIGERRLPIFVRPFAAPASPGTEVSWRRTLREYPVKALSCIPDQALVTVAGNGMLGVPGIAARTFGALHEAGVSVSLISQASSEHSICFSVPAASAEIARRALTTAFADEITHHEIDGVEVEGAVSTIAVVGLGMAGTPGIAARVFESLATAGINIVAIAQGSSELNISLVVASTQAGAAVRVVHAAFQLDRIGGGGVAPANRADVILLGYGQIGRALARMLPRARVGSVRPRIVGIMDRSGFHFDPKGIPPGVLADLARRKVRGHGVGERAGGKEARHPARRYTASAALAEMASHALTRPILVDVTADETAPLLAQALESGMHVVMANKRPLGGPVGTARDLWKLAALRGRRLLHETTVGAGLPIIDTFHKLVESGDRVLRIEGCTSGTLGFLLGEMERGRSFSAALRRAMKLGYTEPDPRDDLSGMDVARKALILGRLIGFGGELADVQVKSLVPDEMRAVSRSVFLARVEVLDNLWRERVAEARARGSVLRYIASATARRVSVGLRPLPQSSPFAALKGTDNQVVFTTRRYRENPLVITGPGAGHDVTAAGVLNDILKAASG